MLKQARVRVSVNISLASHPPFSTALPWQLKVREDLNEMNIADCKSTDAHTCAHTHAKHTKVHIPGLCLALLIDSETKAGCAVACQDESSV